MAPRRLSNKLAKGQLNCTIEKSAAVNAATDRRERLAVVLDSDILIAAAACTWSSNCWEPKRRYSQVAVTAGNMCNQRTVALVLLLMAGGSTAVDNQQSITSSDCSSCWTREAKRYHDLETIKVNILKKLRLRQPPNITVPSRLPNIPLVQQYLESEEMMSDAPWSDAAAAAATTQNFEEWSDTDGVTTVRVIHFAVPG